MHVYLDLAPLDHRNQILTSFHEKTFEFIQFTTKLQIILESVCTTKENYITFRLPIWNTNCRFKFFKNEQPLQVFHILTGKIFFNFEYGIMKGGIAF